MNRNVNKKVTLIFGPENTGKSQLAADIARENPNYHFYIGPYDVGGYSVISSGIRFMRDAKCRDGVNNLVVVFDDVSTPAQLSRVLQACKEADVEAIIVTNMLPEQFLS